MKCFDRIICYETNESMDAVYQGFGLDEDSRRDYNILAVSGSGDMPFFLSQFGKVTAVDFSRLQIEYAKRRMLFLRDGLIDDFLDGGYFRKNIERTRYLKEHFEEIRRSADNITFIESDISSFISETEFSLVYLSNAVDSSSRLDSFLRNIKIYEGGLVYFTNGIDLYYPEKFREHNLVNIRKLSNKAIELEESSCINGNTDFDWSPTVYRKVQ